MLLFDQNTNLFLLHRYGHFNQCAVQARKKEEEAEIAEAIAKRIALGKRAEEISRIARGDKPKVNIFLK